jgi:tripartite-type tricarboxylate transporter receptor subunit TctC
MVYCDRVHVARLDCDGRHQETTMRTMLALRAACLTFTFVVIAGGAFAASRVAQGYPNKPIRLITSSPPGSPPDVAARIFGERLAIALGQPVVVDNRPGAIGTIALYAVSKAAPDGYTLGVLTMSQVLAPALLPHLPYDLVRDFSPVAQLTWASHMLVIRASLPWKTVNDLVAYAKARPGHVTFASGGNATPAHIAGEFLKQRAGIDVRHIPYKGAIAGIAAVLGEQVDLMFAAATASAPYIRSGRLRALATPAPQRVAGFPDVPTMVELGFPGFEIREWHGVLAPARTPRDLIAKMAEEIAIVRSAAETKEQLAPHGLEPAARDRSEAFGALIRSELGRWSVVVRTAGLRAD